MVAQAAAVIAGEKGVKLEVLAAETGAAAAAVGGATVAAAQGVAVAEAGVGCEEA